MFTYHQDPGHGWIEVTTADIASLGLTVAEFSTYSYRSRDGAKLYLEEDCDAAIFIGAYVAKHDRMPELRERYAHNTFVRALPRLR